MSRPPGKLLSIGYRAIGPGINPSALKLLAAAHVRKRPTAGHRPMI